MFNYRHQILYAAIFHENIILLSQNSPSLFKGSYLFCTVCLSLFTIAAVGLPTLSDYRYSFFLMSIPLNVNTLLFPFKIKSIYIYRNWHRFNLLEGLLDSTSILPFKFKCFIRCRREKFCEQGLKMLLICLSNSYFSKAYKISGGPNLTVLVWHSRVSMTIFDLFYVLNLPVHCQNK